ncbi:hypothetical protein [Mesorhizobium escarrei]|uniref:Uncharacterized protein n=1 Tax=Mesorhizobium escarrei TaxID=666018 RepID=A0ABM9DN34_9HYPH|nr:hypothetical protein [Mesorhizobium escarrei]CAH2398059.1 conserved hypothetical protein [Mesorhizobium escarrei]
MDIETDCERMAVELVHEAIQKVPHGGAVSVKAVIAAVRKDNPYLGISDTALVDLIVATAPAFGRAVAFDLNE